MENGRLKLVPVMFVSLAALLMGCVVIPEPSLVSGRQTRLETVDAFSPGAPAWPASMPASPPAAAPALNPEGFSLMNWNMLKGRRQGWRKDFDRLSQGSDVILLQESYLTEELRGALRAAKVNWNLATAFTYRDMAVGVLTASEIAPRANFMHRFNEPLLKIPKTSLFTRFSFSSRPSDLVIVNVHAVNFTMDTALYQDYWQELESILETHDGPLIVAGDFNTWNAQRFEIVSNTARHLGLQAVRFMPDRRIRILNQVVDHVYYRGLVPLNAVVHEVATSDHNPMLVTFKLADAHQGEKAR